jgi:hypothetical protein
MGIPGLLFCRGALVCAPVFFRGFSFQKAMPRREGRSGRHVGRPWLVLVVFFDVQISCQVDEPAFRTRRLNQARPQPPSPPTRRSRAW